MEEAWNVESVDSGNGVYSDLDLIVVVGYEFVIGDGWGAEER